MLSYFKHHGDIKTNRTEKLVETWEVKWNPQEKEADAEYKGGFQLKYTTYTIHKYQ